MRLQCKHCQLTEKPSEWTDFKQQYNEEIANNLSFLDNNGCFIQSQLHDPDEPWESSLENDDEDDFYEHLDDFTPEKPEDSFLCAKCNQPVHRSIDFADDPSSRSVSLGAKDLTGFAQSQRNTKRLEKIQKKILKNSELDSEFIWKNSWKNIGIEHYVPGTFLEDFDRDDRQVIKALKR